MEVRQRNQDGPHAEDAKAATNARARLVRVRSPPGFPFADGGNEADRQLIHCIPNRSSTSMSTIRCVLCVLCARQFEWLAPRDYHFAWHYEETRFGGW